MIVLSCERGIFAMRGTAPASRRARLADDLNPVAGKLTAKETEKWGKVIRAANIKPEYSGHPANV